MAKKLIVFFFLTVMAFVIGLQSPVLGFCGVEVELFLGEHLIEEDCHHSCGHDPVEVPCEHEHTFLTLDLGDFQWSPFEMNEPPVILSSEDFAWVLRPIFSEESIFIPAIQYVDPPPPELPIFRRDAALRV